MLLSRCLDTSTRRPIRSSRRPISNRARRSACCGSSKCCHLKLPESATVWTEHMPLLNESAVVLPIHRKILAFSFIGWIFDFYDLLLLSFLVASTSLTKDLALTQGDVSVLLGTALAFTAVGGTARRRARGSLRPQAAADDHDPDLLPRHAALGIRQRILDAARPRARSPASESAANGRWRTRWSARRCRRTSVAATARTCKADPHSRASSPRWPAASSRHGSAGAPPSWCRPRRR